MTPEYLEQLADLADPDNLWQLGAFEQLDLPPEKRSQLDTGVALRRYAEHRRRLLKVLADRKSLLITPLGHLGSASRVVDTPDEHTKLRRTDGL